MAFKRILIRTQVQFGQQWQNIKRNITIGMGPSQFSHCGFGKYPI